MGDGFILGFGLIFVFFWFLFAALFIGLLVFWIWSLVDVLKRDFKGENDKLVWVLVIVLAGVIGAIIYYFVGRAQGKIPKNK